MTIVEAAEKLGMSPVSVRSQVQRGSLKATKHGRDWWITEGEVARYLRDKRGKIGRPKGAKDLQPRKRRVVTPAE